MPVVKVSWSGGKDSTCAVLEHLKRGNTVKALCYIPMFDETTPLILRAHYDFIHKAADRMRELGAEVHIVHGMTYSDYVRLVTTRGKYKGLIMGFPSYIAGQCNFKYYSKFKALALDIGPYDFEDVGIASDEVKRHSQLRGTKRSILYELGITESQAQEICRDAGLLSPLYTASIKRDGCVLCPHAREEVRQLWFEENPHAVQAVRDLQELVRAQRPDRPPLRGKQWFL